MMEDFKSPILEFQKWFTEAQSVLGTAAEIAALATVNVSMKPSVRMINYKGQREGKFSFFTNYNSKKGSELLENPYAAMTFYWPGIRRQVRILGHCERLSRFESDSYFSTRDRASQATVHTSMQSSVIIDSYSNFITQCTQKENSNAIVVRPEYWGGFGITPHEIELWEGRDARRHYRRQFKQSTNVWVMQELYP